ncbi:MAG: hypothetical protein BM556_13710 [Bacteriovorax sp. MedPE-SWde]|nr:MAG: hypothetical protein BM556_13710 [Bacteriovorax sp. MedPE-SWde]
MKILSILICSLLISNVFADGRGEISFSYHRYTKKQTNQINDLMFSSFEVEDSGELWGGEFKLGIVGKANSKDRENSYLNVNDLYYSFTGPFLSRIDVGYKIYNWSKMEAFHPTDVINARLLDSDIENFDKKGEFSIVFDNEMEFGNLKIYAFPFYEESFFPSADSRISDGVKPSRVKRVTKDGISDSQTTWQYGISLEKQIGELDFLLFGLKHIDRNRPIVGYNSFTSVPLVGNIPTGELAAFYFDVLDLGLASTYFLEDHAFKMEVLNSSFDIEEGQVFLTGSGLRKVVDYTTVSIGHEYPYTWNNGWDSTFFTEYQTVLGVDSETAQELSLFQNDLFVGHRIALNDAFSKEFVIGFFYDLQRKNEWLINIGYDQRLNDFWKFHVGYRGFNHGEDDKLGVYLLEGDDEVSFKLSRFF